LSATAGGASMLRQFFNSVPCSSDSLLLNVVKTGRTGVMDGDNGLLLGQV
jgi:hypothetical protein